MVSTEITLSLQGGHEINLGVNGPDDPMIREMRDNLRDFWLGKRKPEVIAALNGTTVPESVVVAMTVAQYEYVDSEGGQQRLLVGDVTV